MWAADATAPSATVSLSLEGVSKVFQGQRALDDVDLELRRGEIHALLGPNGSGKSTLIKILAGYHRPEPGWSASMHGRPFELGAPAGAPGAHFIHQDLGLVGDLDVVDNLALDGGYEGSWWLSGRRERRRARAALDAFGIDVAVEEPINGLPRAQQTMIAIARALSAGVGEGALLVLDEPTVALSAAQVRRLFEVVRQVRDAGGTVLWVTHRLGEVFALAERVTVLRDGRRVATVPTGELDHDRLVELIVGRPLDAFYPEPPPVGDAPIALEVRELGGGTVADVSLDVRAGEIVGVTGLVGSGHEDLLHLIFGADRPRRGAVWVDGAPVGRGGPARSIAAGLAFAPADRKRLSAILDWTLAENLTLPAIPSSGPAHWIGARRERAETLAWLERAEVVPPEPEKLFSALSGGNQQKLVLARWLRRRARVFLLEEPTNGVDMGSKQAIYEALSDAAREGAAVLMTSQDPEELCAVCDRVFVLRDGRVGVELERARLSEDRIVAETLRSNGEAEGEGR
ncbi:MAG: sugar ABC transporter ATP-binding protein [Actinobacteria bacterium]|nr:sugar ABC transporter ATP-binding protein [Actinomycetota bacterium]